VSETGKINPLPIEFQQPGGYTWEVQKTWTCNGSTYAWEINQIQGKNSANTPIGSFFNFQAAVKSCTTTNNSVIVTPYYQWFSPSQFTNFKNGIFGVPGVPGNLHINGVMYNSYYQVGNNLLTSNFNAYQANIPVNMIDVVQITNDPANRKKDRYGNTIMTNTVFGVAKGKGKWGGPLMSCFTTPTTTYGPAAATNNIQFAMNLMNANNLSSCNQPNIICSSAGGNFPSPPPLSALPVAKIKIITRPVRAILEDIDAQFILPGNWWDDIFGITLTKISGNQNRVFDIEISDLIDENGEIIDPLVSLDEGLYSIGIQFTNGSFISLITETEPLEEPPVPVLADHLTTTIFPVPITENEFSIALSATKNLNVIYKLYDFNMNLLYETEIQIADGESSTINICPENIPDGLLINQFIFEDNSQSSVLTTKSSN